MSETLLEQRDQMLDCYIQDCVTIGKEISVVRADEVRHGTAVGIDREGALLVHFPDGHTEAVSSGEVSIRGMYGYVD
jgi:BirA family biotin operon repressor/biotin-[acetyl-CoA-carboxylase] ligase